MRNTDTNIDIGMGLGIEMEINKEWEMGIEWDGY